jgi:hypothetical protein
MSHYIYLRISLWSCCLLADLSMELLFCLLACGSDSGSG